MTGVRVGVIPAGFRVGVEVVEPLRVERVDGPGAFESNHVTFRATETVQFRLLEDPSAPAIIFAMADGDG